MVACAQCESSPATLECTDEELLYCAPCSASLHSKKARSHHSLRPFHACDECEIAVARVKCAQCGGRGKPLAFCSSCASALHSKKARCHHKVESIFTIEKEIPKNESRSNKARRLPEDGVQCANDVFLRAPTCDDKRGGPAISRQALKESNPNRGCLPHERFDNKQKSKYTKASVRDGRPLEPDLPGRREPREESRSLPRKRHKKSDSMVGTASRERCDSDVTNISPPMPSKKNSGTKQELANPNKASLRKPRQTAGNQSSSSSKGSDEPDASSSEDDDSEDDETYGVKKYSRGSVTYEAFVVDADALDEEYASGSDCPKNHQQDAEGGVQDRIRKMLDLGLHPDTPDIEAQQALKNAQRLLTKHNLRQAEVMKGSLENNDALTGGMRIVELRSKDKKQQCGRCEQWVYSLAETVAVYFDTEYFVRKKFLAQVVFYGIKQNADCAGYAFAATFNRITKLSADYIPSRLSDALKLNKGKVKAGLNQSAYSRVSRMSYKNGIVNGLMEAVYTSKRPLKSNAQGNGINNEVKGILQSAAVNPVLSDCESFDCSSSSGEDSDGYYDTGYTWQDKCAGIGHNDYKKSQKWKEDKSAAVNALILHSKKVGENFLKEKKIKVKQRKIDGPTIWDNEAYVKGKEVSKTIDIGQRGITTKAGKPSGS